jgi:DNA mismatch endonuclease, patch repair protein
MQANRGSDTSPELRLRRALHALGFRYVLGSKLPGKPDLVFPSRRTVVFVDGCFWHRCPEHSALPATNPDRWRAKLDANVQRDRANEMALASLGWKVVRVWEHDVRRNMPATLRRVSEILNR